MAYSTVYTRAVIDNSNSTMNLKLTLIRKLLLFYPIILLLLVSCKNKTSIEYCYERNDNGNISRFKLTKKIISTSHEKHILKYALNSDFIETSQSFEGVSDFRIVNDSIIYKFYKLPKDNLNKCYNYEFYTSPKKIKKGEITPPPFLYQSCFIREVQDTSINNFFIKTCKIYKVNLKETMHAQPITVFLDWDKRIIIQTISKYINTSLVKIKQKEL